MTAYRPRSTRYTRAGSYLSQVYQPRAIASTAVRFRPCFVGKGNRLAMTKNATVARSWREEEELSFTTTAPFIATLDYTAKNDQTPPIRLYDGDGNEVPTTKWSFYDADSDGDYDSVLMNAADYNNTKTYYIDYQSDSRTPLDELPYSYPRSIIRVGNGPDQDYFTENLNPATETSTGDFVVTGKPGSFTIDTDNTYASPAFGTLTHLSGNGTGTLAFGASAAYTLSYSRYYKLTCTIAGASPTFSLQVWNQSSKNTANPQVPLTTSCATITFQVTALTATNLQLIDGVYLTFGTLAGFKAAATQDVYTWWAYGASLIEEHSGYSTSNEQFPSISTPAGSGNTSWAALPPTTSTNTSTSSCAVGSTAAYTGSYVRHYKMQCTAVGGVAASGTITITAANILDNEYVKINNGVEDAYFEFQVTGGFVATSGYITCDIRTLGDNAAAQILLTEINDDTNWTSGAANVTATGPANVITVTNDHKGTQGNQTITTNDVAPLGIVCVGMASGTTRTATICWAGYDEMPYTTGTLSLSEGTSTTYTNASLEAGITLTWTWGAFISDTYFVVGDTWTFTARPGRIYYHGKDDRVYTLAISASAAQAISGSYTADTIEGGYGTWSAVSADNGSDGLVDDLGDNLKFMIRNMGNASAMGGVNATTRHAASDAHTFAATCDDLINWGIDVRVTETFTSSDVIYDAIGAVTGTGNTYYVVLEDTPTTILYCHDASDVDVSYSQVTGSAYVYFATNPISSTNTSFSIKYQHRGKEPSPGAVYYMTGYRLRQSTEYDTPVLWQGLDACKDGLMPSSGTNDILIASEIGRDAGGDSFNEWYTCQVMDLDDDGTYQLSDYKRAIQGTTDTANITDIVVLNKFAAVPTAIQAVEDTNDPFYYPSKVRMLWVGMPANTSIGDEDTTDTLIYTAKHTLAVSGNSKNHGCLVLLGNTYATREIVLDDLSTKSITVDGSFIAAAAVAKQDSFSDVAETLLLKDLNGVFTTMQEFSDAQELSLGESNILYLHPITTNQQRFYESITTDSSAIDYNEISGTKQKHYMIRKITSGMATKMTGWVPPDTYSAVVVMRGFLAELISNEIASGAIAPYGSEQDPPTRRRINPSTDVAIYQDTTIKTDYYYVFWYNQRYPVKRTSGLFGVDSNEIMKGVSRAV